MANAYDNRINKNLFEFFNIKNMFTLKYKTFSALTIKSCNKH